MSEAFDEQLSRLNLMASGNPKWDLSENDCAAIQAVLDRLKYLERGTMVDIGPIKLKLAIDLRCNGEGCNFSVRGEGLDTTAIWEAATKEGWTAKGDLHYCPKCSTP